MAIPIEVKSNPNIPILAPGYTVKVNVKVVEGDRVRTQVFQGVVIKTRGGGINSSFTVRRVAYGVGVERTFPMHSPLVEKVEIVRMGKVRRARLFYLRGLSGKAARIKEKRAELAKEIGIEAVGEEAAEEISVAQEIVQAEDKPAGQESALLEAQKPEARPKPEAEKSEKQE